jgi:hypothetical protein
MPAPLSGPGLGLALPQNLYPSQLYNAPYDSGTNHLTLNAGDQLPIAAGTWYISLGMYLMLEYYDSVTGTWKWAACAGQQGQLHYIKSDGFNYRIANRLGCPIGGIVTNPGGTAYVQASTTISVTGGGGSTWAPIVGGQLTQAGTLVTAQAGAGYGVPPILIIPAPPPPANNANGVGGIQASGYAGISSGTISTIVITNPGAGYPTAPTNIVLLPNPTDPNIATGITLGTVSFSLTGSGSVVGALCTNPGNPISNPANITLTVAGAGTNATVIPAMLQTITACSLVGTSTLNLTTGVAVTSQGGGYSLGTLTNSPEYLGLRFLPRQAQISLVSTGGGTIAAQVGTLIDSGVFASPPSPILQTLPTTVGVYGSVTGSSTIVFTMGSRPDTAIIQPAP